MKSIATIFAVPFLAAPLFAQSGSSVLHAATGDGAATCALVRSDAKRLACYDLLFKKQENVKAVASKVSAVASAPKKSADLETGSWKINAGKTALDGSARVVIRVASEKPLVDQAGQERDVYVYAACRNEKVTMWVNFDQPLEVHPENVPVKVKFDDEFTETLLMKNSYDWRSVGIWDDTESKELLKRLEKSNRLSVKVRRTFGDEVSARFDVSKLSNALIPLQQACGWDRAT